ncbi:MAG: GH3 auxin-responsive promoter family protein [Saprospiraceae bacterium]
MRKIVNAIIKSYLKYHYKRVERIMEHPHEAQSEWLSHMITTNRFIQFGKEHGFKSIRKYVDFAAQIPVRDYEGHKPYIERMMLGEKDILWNGQIKWYAKSSGTTSDKSKFIPISSQNLKKGHIRSSWDSMSIFYHHNPNSQAFSERTILMGGSLQKYDLYPQSIIGDVSAIMMQHIPMVGRPFVAPDMGIAMLPNFEAKLEKMAELLPRENLVLLGGVPTWTVVLIRKILEQTGKSNLLEIWPNLEGYLHGGVSFEPYREQFRQFIPSDKFIYQEIYNASEGFFAVQNDYSTKDMLLLLDNGIFYEFLPMAEWDTEFPTAIPLEDVKIGEHYAIVITTNGGLWRYLIGDTIVFTSTNPYKIQISGRTKQYINVFGEEVMIANTDKAVSLTCLQLNARVEEYSLAPVFLQGNSKGGHEWVIEFEKPPNNGKLFAALLDDNLRKINSDYDAKRFNDLAMLPLVLHEVPKGTFYSWLKSKNRLGGQYKVPRLSNNRTYLEEILQIANFPNLR